MKYDWFLNGRVMVKRYPVRGWLMEDGKVWGFPFSLGSFSFKNLPLINDVARFRLESSHFFNLEVYADNRWQILTEFIYLNSKEAKI